MPGRAKQTRQDSLVTCEARQAPRKKGLCARPANENKVQEHVQECKQLCRLQVGTGVKLDAVAAVVTAAKLQESSLPFEAVEICFPTSLADCG